MYLADGFPVCDGICSLGILVAAFKVVTDERRAQRLDHEIVVVQSCNHNCGRDASNGSGDVGSRHVDWLVCVLIDGQVSSSVLGSAAADGRVAGFSECCICCWMMTLKQ